MIRVAELSVFWKYFKWEFPKKPQPFNLEKWNVEKWIRDKEEVHDCDQAGDRTSFWVVVSDDAVRYYRCSHSWGWESAGDWGDKEEAEFYNEFRIGEVQRSDITGDAKENLRFVV